VNLTLAHQDQFFPAHEQQQHIVDAVLQIRMFAANVRQVRFNAWHYCDDRLWSGLVEHLFRTLAADPDTADDPGTPADPDASADPGTVAARRAELSTQLAKLDTERKQLSEALDAAGSTRQPTGFLARIGSPAYIARIATATFRELVNDLRAAPWALLAWAALGGAAYAAWSLWGSLIGAAATAITVTIAPAAAVVQRLWSWHNAGTGITARLRQRLEERQRAINQELASVRERLALVDATAKLSAFLNDRASPHAYQEFRGLLGQVRSDLEKLSNGLADARREWEASRASAAAPLERIVLYIDDLDRCPPRRVVEVLEAIHLMLTLDLFVVVVAVDARWLVKSLECHYQEMFGTGKDPTVIAAAGAAEPDADSGPASPVDYLDKIFQIPYVLAPPSTEAMASYLRWLLSPAASSSTRATPGQRPHSASRSDRPGPDPGLSTASAPDPVNTGESVNQPRQPRDANMGGAGVTSGHDEHPHPRQTEEPGTRIRDLRPRRLQLSQAEIEFMAGLGSVMPTPRAAKRFANLYRLVRIGILDADLADFIGSEAGGPYQVVQILLAVLVASPATAQRIFREIKAAPDGSDILTVFAGASEFTGGDFCDRIRMELARISGDIPLLTGIEEFRRWCPTLARYSFHTRTMAGEGPPSGASGLRT